MLAYARSRSLPDAPIARTIIWIRSCKLYFSSAAAFGFFTRARRRALGGSGIALGNLGERRRGSLVGRPGIVPPCRWGRSGLRRRRVRLRRRSLGELELRSAADARFASLRAPENHNIIRSAFVTGRWLPQKPSNYSKRCHSGILHNVLCRGSMLWLPEVTCCCQIHSMNKTSKSGLISDDK